MGSPTDTMYFVMDPLLECGEDTLSSSAIFCAELELALPFLNSKGKLIIFTTRYPIKETLIWSPIQKQPF